MYVHVLKRMHIYYIFTITSSARGAECSAVTSGSDENACDSEDVCDDLNIQR